MAVPRDHEILFYLDPQKLGSLASKRQMVRELVKPTFTRSSSASAISRSGRIRWFAADVPRIEWVDLDGDGTRETPGILLEQSRTNSFTQSEDLSSLDWTKTGASITANAATAPDGAATADRIVEDLSTGVHSVKQTKTLTANANYSLSAFVKKETRSRVRLKLADSTATDTIEQIFDLASGTVVGNATTTGTAVLRLARIEALADSWYRCSLSANIGNGRTSIVGELLLDNGASASYTGDGQSSLLAWGLQLENSAAYPSSYIATTTAAVTRAEDILTWPFTWGSGLNDANDDFTLYVKVARPAHADVSGSLENWPGPFRVGTADPRCFIYFQRDSRLIAAVIRSPAGVEATQPIPAGRSIEIVAQYKDLRTGGRVAIDVGSGLSSFSGAAGGFSAFGDRVLRPMGFDAWAGHLITAKIARGLFTMAEMRAA